MDISNTVIFWTLLVVLNSLYFWPRFILEDGKSDILPLRGFSADTMKRRLRWLLIRLNYDPFRVSVEFVCLALAYPLFLHPYIGVIPFALIAFVYFGLSLAYQVYYTAFDKIYNLEPVLFHDWFMIKVALRIFIFEFSWKNFFIAIAAVVFSVLVFVGIYFMCLSGAEIELSTGGYLLFGVVLFLGLLSANMYDAVQFPQVVFQSQLISFMRNMRSSNAAAHQVRNLKLTNMVEYNVDPSARLVEKPNIYFIVVESYGRVIADQPEFREGYVQLLDAVGSELASSGWESASNYTISPITAGASWISYTSMLYGLNVKGQGLFLTLFKNTRISEYDSLFNWLRRQGYQTFRISNLGGYKKMDIPYDRYSELYGVDRWILHGEMGFKGKEYGFGPSPPDQYAVFSGQEIIERESDGPTATFYISQNSHTPFETPTEVVDDWRTLVDEDYVAPAQSKIWSRPKFDLYGEAISYQLRYLSDFIRKKGGDNAIYVLVGDHQPASLSIPITNFQTPMHVISKDRAFLSLWNEYGFGEGLRVVDDSRPIRQEAILWALYRCLLKRYGNGAGSIPDFLEKGIPF